MHGALHPEHFVLRSRFESCLHIGSWELRRNQALNTLRRLVLLPPVLPELHKVRRYGVLHNVPRHDFSRLQLFSSKHVPGTASDSCAWESALTYETCVVHVERPVMWCCLQLSECTGG